MMYSLFMSPPAVRPCVFVSKLMSCACDKCLKCNAYVRIMAMDRSEERVFSLRQIDTSERNKIKAQLPGKE